jgi:hypothetical protein
MRPDRDAVSRIFTLSDLTTTTDVGSGAVATVRGRCGAFGAAEEFRS